MCAAVETAVHMPRSHLVKALSLCVCVCRLWMRLIIICLAASYRYRIECISRTLSQRAVCALCEYENECYERIVSDDTEA